MNEIQVGAEHANICQFDGVKASVALTSALGTLSKIDSLLQQAVDERMAYIEQTVFQRAALAGEVDLDAVCKFCAFDHCCQKETLSTSRRALCIIEHHANNHFNFKEIQHEQSLFQHDCDSAGK